MNQYCTQCGAENDNDAKFCKSCGLPLIQPAKQIEQHVKSIEIKAQQLPSVEPMKSSMLWIFPILWVIYSLIFVSYGVIMIETIAEALGGSIVILGIPLIITGIIRLIKKLNNTSYPNFVKHTFIGTIIMFFLAIAGNINTKMEQSTKNTNEESMIQAENPIHVEEIAPTKENNIEIEKTTSETSAQNRDKLESEYTFKALKILSTNPKQAIYYVDKALEINPNNSACYAYKGTAYDLLGEPQKAIRNYNKAISLSFNEAFVYLNRGNTYWAMGNIKKAKADANKACSLGDCKFKKEIEKWEKENSEPIEEQAAPEYQVPMNE